MLSQKPLEESQDLAGRARSVLLRFSSDNCLKASRKIKRKQIKELRIVKLPQRSNLRRCKIRWRNKLENSKQRWAARRRNSVKKLSSASKILIKH